MSKYKTFNAHNYADIFKALSNPNRLRILSQMARHCKPGTCCPPEEFEKCCVGDLGENLDIAPSTLSHHIKELNRAGLIQMERRGQHMDCWVNKEILEILQGFFTEKNLSALL
jgi:ArsR family transcriptional regulator